MAEILGAARIPVHVFAPPGTIQSECITQAENVANLPVSFHHVALMPDAHVGYGIPVGGVAAIENALIPYAVGNDIGCGVATCDLGVDARSVGRGELGRSSTMCHLASLWGRKRELRHLRARYFRTCRICRWFWRTAIGRSISWARLDPGITLLNFRPTMMGGCG